MSKDNQAQILLSNDDGIRSPGLWTAAEALSELGFVTVAAPREQSSSTSRSLPPTSDGAIHKEKVQVGGMEWEVFSVGGTPAQAVQHGMMELMEHPPDLVVAGINYGENVTLSVTISGTVGAALEGASYGIPSLAISMEVDEGLHLTHSEDVDFRVAGHFARYFAKLLMEKELPADVDVLKVDVPAEATKETPWELCFLESKRYYIPQKPDRKSLDQPATLRYQIISDFSSLTPGSDAHAVRVLKHVAVTPLSLDLTSRASFSEIEDVLRYDQ
ncbi:MAG: 5'/3'-nucleotidase SurE [Anaerolineales bacterium]